MRQNTNPDQIPLFNPVEDRSAIERERVRRPCHYTYDSIISLENLLSSWQEFLKGKRKRKDVAVFSLHFMGNILALNKNLQEKTYQHGRYHAFKINDPKPRDIHKATVRDRITHHAIYKIMYPYFDNKFIFDSYSCRNNKGTHKTINRLGYFARKVSGNNTRDTWVLKCDIKKFFANINHGILKGILKKHIANDDIIWLLEKIIDSFHTKNNPSVGLPLGNITSQLLINVYMNEFDQFVKRELKVKYYVRYADDFVTLHTNRVYLESLIPQMSKFLEQELGLSLHPNKVYIRHIVTGVDFLGWVHFPHHRVLRTSTKHRMFKKLKYSSTKETLASYLGMLKHGNTYKLIQRIEADTRIY